MAELLPLKVYPFALKETMFKHLLDKALDNSNVTQEFGIVLSDCS